MRHVYRILLHDGSRQQLEGKKALVEQLENLCVSDIAKIIHYKSNGHWGDVTKLYLPEMR